MKTPTLLIVLLFLLNSVNVFGQLDDDEFFYGFSAGATYTSISDIETTLIRPVFDQSTYNTSISSKLGAYAGFFIFHRFHNSSFAVQPEVSYAMYGGDFNYSDIEELDYTLSFNYQYFNLGVLMKVYPTGGFFFSLGPQVGINIANSNLSYVSNMPELGPDLQIEQSLKEVLKGKTDFSIMAGFGYDFEFGLVLEARYKLGLADVIETQSNGFNFIENDNFSRGFQFTIGYAIPFY